MPSPDEYVTVECHSVEGLVEAVADRAKKGVHSGRILQDAPMTGSYYHKDQRDSTSHNDGSITAIAATTIAEFADFSALPSDHILCEIQRGSHNEQMSPSDLVKINKYTSVRGILFHRYLSSKIERDKIKSAARQELSIPQNEWHQFWRTIAKYHNAPQINPPGFYIDPVDMVLHRSKLLKNESDAQDIVLQGMKREIEIAEKIFKESWGQYEGYNTCTEVPFVSEIAGCRFGGCVDRICTIDKSKVLPEGVFAVDLKFTEAIRPKDVLQVEAYRRAFESSPSIAGPIEGAIVRIDIFEGETEILTSLDDMWPSDAWSLFYRTHARWHDKFDTADLHLRRSSEGM